MSDHEADDFDADEREAVHQTAVAEIEAAIAAEHVVSERDIDAETAESDECWEALSEDEGVAFAFDDDGACYDPRTGEYYDPDDAARFEGLRDAMAGAKAPDLIETFDDADRALLKLAEIETEMVAIQKLFDAARMGYEARMRSLTNRRRWWAVRFEAPVMRVAKKLRKGKSKTMQFNWGSVSERTVRGRDTIINNAGALQWARNYAPEVIKTVVTVKAQALADAKRLLEKECGGPIETPFLLRQNDTTHTTIRTGVLAEGIKHVE